MNPENPAAATIQKNAPSSNQDAGREAAIRMMVDPSFEAFSRIPGFIG